VAQANLASAELLLRQAERLASRELRQAWQGLNSSLAKAEASRLALEAAEQSYRDQTRDFKNALVTSLDLLNAFQAVETARLDHLRARYDAQLAALRLRLASGTPTN
jgi:outer membrane protein